MKFDISIKKSDKTQNVLRIFGPNLLFFLSIFTKFFRPQEKNCFIKLVSLNQWWEFANFIENVSMITLKHWFISSICLSRTNIFILGKFDLVKFFDLVKQTLLPKNFTKSRVACTLKIHFSHFWYNEEKVPCLNSTYAKTNTFKNYFCSHGTKYYKTAKLRGPFLLPPLQSLLNHVSAIILH